jgi:isopentenyl-diphosphate Delta-isomerase
MLSACSQRSFLSALHCQFISFRTISWNPLHHSRFLPTAISNISRQQACDYINLSSSFNNRRRSMTTWDAAGLTQEDFMHKDECILVDPNDNIVGHGSKYDAHRFNTEQPSGILHRAFSVFLFDSQNRLLLQQRAASKITFPSVWTNTCCSHPLYGYQPTEVDSLEDVASGDVPGVKRAAIRKLLHELGIRPEYVPIENFHFLTRLHYCARDGPEGEWGEHEVDYILFLRASSGETATTENGVNGDVGSSLPLEPNPEEVMDTRYVTQEELISMMDPSSGLLWSPWFRIIAEKFLSKWWSDADSILSGESPKKHLETDKVHKIM